MNETSKRGLITSIHVEDGKATIRVITHQSPFSEYYCEATVTIEDGKLVLTPFGKELREVIPGEVED